MVENQSVQRQVVRRKKMTRFGIVSGNRDAGCLTNIDHRNGVKTAVSLWIGIDAEQCGKRDVEVRLFFHLTDAGILDTFADIDEAARKRESDRLVGSLDQDDTEWLSVRVEAFDNSIGRQEGSLNQIKPFLTVDFTRILC